MENKLLAQEIITAWNAGQEEFEFESSGTTGTPKILKFSRDQIIWSCRQTERLLNIQNPDQQLCVLPVSKTGGKMQIFRSLVWGIPIEVAEPDYLLNKESIPSEANIVSLTPMMLWQILQQPEGKSKIAKFKHLLIGGGDFQFNIELHDFPSTAFYHTYGMTESLSHIAVKRLGTDKVFKTLEGTEIRKNQEDETLEFRNVLTSGQWSKTNDIIELISNNEFVVKGRKDNVINSGGVKINPEMIEHLIYEQLNAPVNSFFIIGKEDEILGQKLVLVYDSALIERPEIEAVQFDYKFQKPKELIAIQGFVINESNKINRVLTLGKINRSF